MSFRRWTYPVFDNSAMDGYAVRPADLTDGAALPVAGKAFAGQPFHDAPPAGTCIRIMTGAPVPEGCDAVVMQEETEQSDAGVRFIAPVKAGQKYSPARGRYRQRCGSIPGGYASHRGRAAGAGVAGYCQRRGSP